MLNMEKNYMDSLLTEVLQKKPVTIEFPRDISRRDVILYGAGNQANLALTMLNKTGVKIRYIVDGNPEIQGNILQNYIIRSPEDISEEDATSAIFVICVVTYPYDKIKARLTDLGCIDIFPFYDYMINFKDTVPLVNSWICSPLTKEEISEIWQVYNSFADIRSQAAYLQVLYWRILRQELYFNNNPISMQEKFFPPDIMPTLKEDEVLLDCGAYTGGTIEMFLDKTSGNFKQIFAYEPDRNNYQSLLKYIGSLPALEKEKIFPYNTGMGEKKGCFSFINGDDMACRFSDNHGNCLIPKVTIDDEMKNRHISIIKIHAESDELSVLKGGIDTIKRCRPILLITIYHSQEGLWELPKYLMDNLKHYKFYHRSHAYCGIESILYSFPDERISKNRSD